MMRVFVGVLFLVAAGLSAQPVITEAQFKALLAQPKPPVVLDVRTAEEFAAGHLAPAVLLPYDAIHAKTAAQAIPAKDTPVVVYCRSGRRSALAAQTLKGLGYTKVSDFGGLNNWRGPLVTGSQ